MIPDGQTSGGGVTCPFCGGVFYTGHTPDCRLDAADRERIKEIAREAVEEYVKVSLKRSRRAV